jgi:GNAT superfamily N-acetyltransferase
MLARLAEREPTPTKLVAEVRENESEMLGLLKEQGFVRVMREASSLLHVADYDFSRFAGAQERVCAQGIEIRCLQDLMEVDPGWKQKLYDLEWEVAQDIPSPAPITPSPVAQWEKQFGHPDFRADSWFIALNHDQYVGLSTLWVTSTGSDKIYQGITGVIRSHRRRGVATALKLRGFEFAQRIGARRIQTDNEENNPMYQLNLALGFKPQPALLIFEKTMDGN